MYRQTFVYLYIYFAFIGIIETKKFKIKLISNEKCKDPIEKADPTEPVVYETGTANLNKHTKVAWTNFTVLRSVPVTMSLRIHHLRQNAEKEEIFKIEKVVCHNPITYQLTRVVNLKLSNACMAIPGSYLTEKINPQDFSWILTKAMIHPGKYEYVLEFHTDKGLAVCNSIICDIQETK